MTISRRATLVAAIATALTVGGLVGHAAAASLRQPVHPLLAGTVAALTVNGPVTVNMDATHAGVTINGRQGSDAQPLRIFDYLGNPIAGVNSAGGMWVAGDDFRVFPPGDVFNASITLHKGGGITIGGPQGPTIYGGAADPNTSSPCVTLAMIQAGSVPDTLDRPCMGGDRYLRTNGDTLVFNGTWTVK